MKPNVGICALLIICTVGSLLAQAPAAQTSGQPGTGARELFVVVGKSVIVDSPVAIQRVSVANGDVAEAVAISPREVLVNGKATGETSLIIWQQNGERQFFDVIVDRRNVKLETVQRELEQEMHGKNVSLT